MDYAERPMLVFWETTRACLLACRHCRASATTQAPPGELTTAEGHRLIDQVAGFGCPYPILVLTGGDCLLRPDLFDLTRYATSLGVPVCLSPSVTPLLDAGMISRIAASGVKAVSVSLDGASAGTHDGVRGIPGHFGATTAAIRDLVSAGMKVQVNTTVMTGNVAELADVAALLAGAGAQMWEVFFLVQVGRGRAAGAISAAEHDDVCHFLYDASRYGFVVRTVEAPFFRRTVLLRREGCPPPDTALYTRLAGRLRELLGPPARQPSAHTAATRDGKGIMFISSTGDAYPAGFLPLSLGNVRRLPLRDIYTSSPLLRDIRAARFAGRCGQCGYADLCGGSRARAYAATGDPLGEDPACSYRPHTRLAGARGLPALGDGQQDDRVPHRLEAVRCVGDHDQVTVPAFPALVARREHHPAADHVHAGLAGARVLGHGGVLDHGDDRLPEHLLVAADDGLRGTAPGRAGRSFKQFTRERVQGELLHRLPPLQMFSYWRKPAGLLAQTSRRGQYGTPIFRQRRPLVPGSAGRAGRRLR